MIRLWTCGEQREPSKPECSPDYSEVEVEGRQYLKGAWVGGGGGIDGEWTCCALQRRGRLSAAKTAT
jgi:hypothetical protein